MPDLRGFIDLVRQQKPRDILDVYRSVSPWYETTAVITKLEQAARYPIVFFHDIRNSRFPVVSNVCATQSRLAMALGCSSQELRHRYAEGCERPLKPELKKDGPVQEQVFMGKQADLGILPQLLYHEGDAPRPYVTAAIIAATDPETSKTNLSFHRLMLRNENTTTIFMARGKHLEQIFQKYKNAGQPMPISAFIGVHPACALGALYTGELEEYEIIGGLLRSPLPVVKCLTNHLHVPAEAEFVLEGMVSAYSQAEEGPFGEYTGYATGTSCCPIFIVQALSCRKDPIYQDIVGGSMEHLLLPIPGMEYHLLHLARNAAHSTTDVKITLPLTVFVSLDKKDDSQPRQIAEALLASDIYVKHVVVVDSDVDISDLRKVATALVLHTRPDRDILVQRGCLGTELDPSRESPDEPMIKIGIDATVPLKKRERVQRNRVPQAVLDSISLTELLGRV